MMTPGNWRSHRLHLIVACCACGPALAPGQPAAVPLASAAAPLSPFGAAGSSGLHPAWQLLGLPGRSAVPLTRFEAVSRDGESVLQISTDKSYGVLTHRWQGPAPAQLEWRWRVDQALMHTDLATRAGDDAALKVCIMFDQPAADIPLLQRASLALARATTGQDIPSATLCYVWDSRYPSGTPGVNPYSARVRYLVLSGSGTPMGQWTSQRRAVALDFQRLFGQESAVTPAVVAVAVAADSDNTQGQSLAYVSQLRWLP